jgi:hypothetical protein
MLIGIGAAFFADRGRAASKPPQADFEILTPIPSERLIAATSAVVIGADAPPHVSAHGDYVAGETCWTSLPDPRAGEECRDIRPTLGMPRRRRPLH